MSIITPDWPLGAHATPVQRPPAAHGWTTHRPMPPEIVASYTRPSAPS